LWNGETGKTSALASLEDDKAVNAVKWAGDGTYISVGTSDGEVELWNAAESKKLRTLRGHVARTATLAWCNGAQPHLLTSGSRDGHIHHWDVRVREALVSRIQAHAQEVCGLEWSQDGTLLATGGNDNKVQIFEAREGSAPRHTFTDHCAAVKALAWCPWQRNLLATGGGTADRTIRFWNAQSGACLNSVDTHSQVCDLKWSLHDKELVSGHGFSQNQLSVWKYPSLVKVADLEGHTSRVLNLTQSPDGTTVLSASADETLRFWRIFSKAEKPKAAKTGGPGPIR